jgi:hypothetical protein
MVLIQPEKANGGLIHVKKKDCGPIAVVIVIVGMLSAVFLSRPSLYGAEGVVLTTRPVFMVISG